jgi:hypothetical protein
MKNVIHVICKQNKQSTKTSLYISLLKFANLRKDFRHHMEHEINAFSTK